MSTPRPTPETDVKFAELEGISCIAAVGEMSAFARKLERERDEAREYAERCKQGCIKLSFAIDRIDYACGEPNEFEVSDYALHQDEEHVVQRVKEKFEAMREAIKEAHDSLLECREQLDRMTQEGIKERATNTLAKLRPFLP